MTVPVFGYRLTALTPWAWHGLAVPSGTATLHDLVTDTSMAFSTAFALGMGPRWPCLPTAPDYRGHLASIPFKPSLFCGSGNRLNRPLARRLNLDAEGGLPASIHRAVTSGNIKNYFHIQEVAVGSTFRGVFLHSDPLALTEKAYGEKLDRLVVRLGLGRVGVGLLERCAEVPEIRLNLHTAQLFDPDVSAKAEADRLYNIRPTLPLEPGEALRITATWS